MQSQTTCPDKYLAELSEDRRRVVARLRQSILHNLPSGFEERMSYGMLGYVVPHSKYPLGYHCAPELPLPFINLASQKNYIALYHMGIYVEPKLLAWFVAEYPKHCRRKLDMGKSCIRFKYMDEVPYELVGELASKMTVDRWIALYDQNVKKNVKP